MHIQVYEIIVCTYLHSEQLNFKNCINIYGEVLWSGIQAKKLAITSEVCLYLTYKHPVVPDTQMVLITCND